MASSIKRYNHLLLPTKSWQTQADKHSENLWWVSVNQNNHKFMNDIRNKERSFSFYFPFFILWSHMQRSLLQTKIYFPLTNKRSVDIFFEGLHRMLLISNWPYNWNCHISSTSPLVTSLLYISLFIGILQIFVQRSSHRRHFVNLLQEQVFPFKKDISSLPLKKCLKREFCLTALHSSLQPNKMIGILILTCSRFLLTWKVCWVFLSKPSPWEGI